MNFTGLHSITCEVFPPLFSTCLWIVNSTETLAELLLSKMRPVVANCRRFIVPMIFVIFSQHHFLIFFFLCSLVWAHVGKLPQHSLFLCLPLVLHVAMCLHAGFWREGAWRVPELLLPLHFVLLVFQSWLRRQTTGNRNTHKTQWLLATRGLQFQCFSQPSSCWRNSVVSVVLLLLKIPS